VRSAGPKPGTAPHPQVVAALREVGLEASDHMPRKLDAEVLEWADVANMLDLFLSFYLRYGSWELPNAQPV
jgi:protein-tyrosine-phosphatase